MPRPLRSTPLRNETLEARRLMAADLAVDYDLADAKVEAETAYVADTKQLTGDLAKHLDPNDFADAKDLTGSGGFDASAGLEGAEPELGFDLDRLRERNVGQDTGARSIRVGDGKWVLIPDGDNVVEDQFENGGVGYTDTDNGGYAVFYPNGDYEVAMTGAEMRDEQTGDVVAKEFFSGNLDGQTSGNDADSQAAIDSQNATEDTIGADIEAGATGDQEQEALDQAVQANEAAENASNTAGGDNGGDGSTDDAPTGEAGDGDQGGPDDEGDEEGDQGGETGMPKPDSDGSDGGEPWGGSPDGGADEGGFTAPSVLGRGGLVGDPTDDSDGKEGPTLSPGEVGSNNGGLVTNPGDEPAGDGVKLGLNPMAVDAILLKWTGTYDPPPLL